VDDVQLVFYRDNNKPDMDNFHDIREIAELAGYQMPNNYYEQNAFLNNLRQCVYGVRKREWRENGRKLLSVKMMKGEPVVYGFSTRVKFLKNDLSRERQKTINQIERYQQTARYIGRKLPKRDQLLLDYFDNTLPETEEG
jgi:hypothetical protein